MATMPITDKERLLQPIDDINLPTLRSNGLTSSGILKVWQYCLLSEQETRSVPNFGPKSREALQNYLGKLPERYGSFRDIVHVLEQSIAELMASMPITVQRSNSLNHVRDWWRCKHKNSPHTPTLLVSDVVIAPDVSVQAKQALDAFLRWHGTNFEEVAKLFGTASETFAPDAISSILGTIEHLEIELGKLKAQVEALKNQDATP